MLYSSINEFSLYADTTELIFRNVDLNFLEPNNQVAPFTLKSNRTLAHALQQKQYKRVVNLVGDSYREDMNTRLGDFVSRLHANGDEMYRVFLNEYGIGPFCRFNITDKKIGRLKGLYAYTLNDSLKYIGKTTVSFSNRISNGYGVIHERKRYLDGRNTDCHLNNLITSHRESFRLKFWACALSDKCLIESAEAAILQELKPKPEWNIQIPRAEKVSRLKCK